MHRRPIFSLAFAAALVACGTQPNRPRPAAPPDTLYTQLGGQPAIEGLVDALVAEYKADPRIRARFALPAEELAYLRARLVEQLCAATGGGCAYTGLPMPEAHSGMNITQAEFDAFLHDTVKAMTRLGIRDEHQLIILSVLESMQADVVGQ